MFHGGGFNLSATISYIHTFFSSIELKYMLNAAPPPPLVDANLPVHVACDMIAEIDGSERDKKMD